MSTFAVVLAVVGYLLVLWLMLSLCFAAAEADRRLAALAFRALDGEERDR